MMFNLEMVGNIKLVYSTEASSLLGKDHWYLDEDISVELTTTNKKISFTILRGFLTDGTSITRLLHSLIPIWDKNTSGVVIHDWLCSYPMVNVNGNLVKLSREEVDRVFLYLMELNGISKIRRTLMYAGVCAYDLFGIKKYKHELVTKETLEDKIRATLDSEDCDCPCECA